jgi:hypothetical protein
VPVGLAAAVAAAVEDPRCAMVAQASQWSAAALAYVSILCHGRGDISDPQVPFSLFPVCFTVLGPCLNMSYTRNILALEI